ncbi:lysophosphatidylcholine acyltransferase 2-like [Diadema setosum]|uniref:lysophosphatidylcholine acyltransferase 2-like n=1 Tax=Diadema setosum TaxID=31175 RepID=UPI003B3BC547
MDDNKPSKRPRLLREKSFAVPEIQNPFRHEINLNVWDYVRIAIMSVTLAPIRFVLTILLLLPAWVLCFTAFLGMREEDRKKPLGGWRKALSKPVLAIARFQFFCLGFHYVKVKGRQVSKDEALILAVAPHTTFFDTLVIFMCGLTSGVSRQENADIPFFGTLTKFLQPVLVSRKDPNSRQNTIAEIKHRAQLGSQWPQLIIFPEGTTTNGTCLITFKGGAFFPGVPIQPVVIKYTNKINTFAWTWDGPGTLTVLWLSLCNVSNNFEIEFLPVYKPSEAEIKDAKLFANNVRSCMAKSLNVPVTDHTYEDCRLMEEAASMGLPCEVGVVEFSKLLRKLGFKLEHLRSHLTKFAEIARSGGYITLDDFAKYLNVPVTQALKEVFEVYDRDGSGKIDFREYVIGCALVSQPANTDDTIQMAFKMFGGDKEYITREDLFQILDNAFGMKQDECDQLFSDIDTLGLDRITYDEFKAYAMKKPEYATLFTRYMEMPTEEHSPSPSPSPSASSLPVEGKRVPDLSRSSPDLSPRRRKQASKKDNGEDVDTLPPVE